MHPCNAQATSPPLSAPFISALGTSLRVRSQTRELLDAVHQALERYVGGWRERGESRSSASRFALPTPGKLEVLGQMEKGGAMR